MANTHSHLTLSDRIYIEQALERRMKFRKSLCSLEKIQPQFPRRSAGTGSSRNRAGKRRCVKTGAPVQSSICAARSIAISCAGNAPCTTAIPTAKITLLPYADALPRRLMFVTAAGFGAVGRT